MGVGRIIKFVKWAENKKDIINYHSPTVRPEDYTEIVIRQKMFFYLDEFFLLLKNNKIIGLVSVGTERSIGNSVAGIRIVICPEKYLTRLLHYAHSHTPIISIVEYTKIRFFEHLTNRSNPKLLETLKKVGYKDEGILKNEFGMGNDVKIWAYCYDKKAFDQHRNTKTKLFKNLIEET